MENNASYNIVKNVIDKGLEIMRNPNLTEEHSEYGWTTLNSHLAWQQRTLHF